MAPVVAPWLSCLLPLLASFTSGLASAYLLVSLNRLPPQRRQKLLIRQLQHLAAADTAYAVFEVVRSSLDLSITAGLVQGVPHAGNGICGVLYGSSEVGNMASLMFEAHLALAFAASTSKSTRALGVLSRSVPFVWLLGVFLAVASLLTSQPVWDERDDYACGHLHRMWVKMVTVFTVFIVCVFCYVISCCFVMTSGQVVQRFVGLRGQTYVVIALIFMTPMTVYDAHSISPDPSGALKDWWPNDDLAVYMVCKTLYNLNGLLNFAMYTLMCRQARQLRQPVSGPGLQLKHAAPSEHVFAVAFREGESIIAEPQQSCGNESQQAFVLRQDCNDWYEWRHTDSSDGSFAMEGSFRG